MAEQQTTAAIKMALQAQLIIILLIKIILIIIKKTYLDLFSLENRSNAGVEGGTREHRGNWVGEVQDLLKVGGHVLQKRLQGQIHSCVA